MDTTQIQRLVDRRAVLRRAGYWHNADRIRSELEAHGVVVEDRPDGTTWRRSLSPIAADVDAFWARIKERT